ncbi:MAG: plasmid pRiA4b ORF-3 family protein [Alkalibacterium sp.]|nr:plasmid pRiA4b ORF-3 family protein [Alkalibacterium sp.]
MKAFKDAEKLMNEENTTLMFNETEDLIVPKESFFRWHGNLVKFEEKECIVLTNDATGFTLIFLNPYEEDYIEFGDWLSEALSRMMKRMGFSDESVIDYFKAFGEYTVSRASNQTLMGKNSASSQLAGAYDTFINTDECFQDSWSFKVSEMKKGEDGSVNAVQAFINQFKKSIGDYYIDVDMAELEIRLKLQGMKDVVRIVQVPMNVTFDDLHTIIQTVFMWQDAHLHQFVLEDGYTLVGAEGYSQMQQFKREGDDLTDSGNHYLLSDIISYDENKAFTYIYDFGDFWEHTIHVRKIWTEHQQMPPRLKMMLGDPVPENVGGAGGYAYFLEVMKDPHHPEFSSLKAWANEYEESKHLTNTVESINNRLLSKRI